MDQRITDGATLLPLAPVYSLTVPSAPSPAALGPSISSSTPYFAVAVSRPTLRPSNCAIPVVMEQDASTKSSTYAICPHCQHAVTTCTRSQVGLATWMSAVCCCLVGFWLCGCLWPFCCACTKDTVHYCPVCKAILSCYQRL